MLSTFQVRLIDRLPLPRMSPFDMLSYSSSGGYVDLAEQMLGFAPDYGHLTAYMIRRFGFPNSPGNPDKNLIGSWLLSTPRDDTVLVVSPSPSSSSMASLSFRCLIPGAAVGRFAQWMTQDRDDWHQKAFDAIEAEGGPPPEWIVQAKRFLQPFKFAKDNWRAPMMLLPHHARHLGPEVDRDKFNKLASDIEALMRLHSGGAGMPPLRERGPDWRQWSEDDPQRAYMAALQATFDDLQSPVFVRDVAIGLKGRVADGDPLREKATEACATSVYPVGLLLAGEPDDAGSLFRHLRRLGDGDMSEGLRQAVGILDKSSADAEVHMPEDSCPAP